MDTVRLWVMRHVYGNDAPIVGCGGPTIMLLSGRAGPMVGWTADAFSALIDYPTFRGHLTEHALRMSSCIRGNVLMLLYRIVEAKTWFVCWFK